MSRRKLNVFLSLAANEDLQDILQYTFGTWGAAQMDVYAAAIDHGLQNLSRYPRLGLKRDDLFRGCRSFQIEHHIVYYRSDKTTLYVARILHERMDEKQHLG